MSELTTRDLVELVEKLYPPARKSDWDQIGLVCGRLDQEVTGVVVAVDLTHEVIDFAEFNEANFVLVHHPLFLSGVHEVSEERFKGEFVHRLIEGKIALMVAHTNADAANPGVSDALAAALGLSNTVPIEIIESEVVGLGESGPVGIGRVGALETPMSLRDFASLVADATPATAQGVRVAGDLDRMVQRVAVCGGSGDSYLDLLEPLGVDVYLTSDLKHHRTRDHLDAGGCAVVDIPHWASEFPWCEVAARSIATWLGDNGIEVPVAVYEQPTDPWVLHLESGSSA